MAEARSRLWAGRWTRSAIPSSSTRVAGAKRVKCATDKWTLIAECPTGQYCLETPDPTAAGTGKKVTECKQAATAAPTDAGSTGDTTTASDAGPQKTPAEQVSCIQSNCAAEFNACMAYAPCGSVLNCVKACSDDACADACGATVNQEDKQLGPLVVGLFVCGDSKGCLPKEPDPKPICGDGNCDDTETPLSCAADCKVDGPKCGNEKCEAGETPASCPQDCEPEGPKCGNGKCEAGETPSTCASDCKSSSSCGDGMCTSPENSNSCVIDCDENYSPVMSCAKSQCAGQYSACAETTGCLAAMECGAKCDKADSGSSCTDACLSAAGSAESVMMSLGTCISQKCVDTPQPECSASKACASGKKCVEGVCVPDSTPGCASDSQCGAGNKCVEGKCVTGGEVQCGDGKCEGNEQSTCPSDCGNASGTCKDKCGKFEAGATCQCDTGCVEYKDCCPDYQQLCAP